MGLFDPWMMSQQFGGLLGGGAPANYSQKDIEELIKGYGPQWSKLAGGDAPQIPIDPSGGAPMGSAPPNPYGNPAGLMPTPTSTLAASDPQQQPGGPWVRPGSLLDKFITSAGAGTGGANAAPIMPGAPPLSSGTEPSAVWGNPAQQPQMANVPMPLPRPAPGVNLGAPQPAPQQPGPPLSILPQNGNQAPQIQAPQGGAQAPQGPSFMDGFQNRMQNIAGILDPSQRSQLQETGVDPLTGEKSFAWVNSANRTMTPATASGGTPGGTTISPLVNAVRAGVSGEKLWEYVPKEYKGRLTAMLEGREAPPTGAGMRNPQIQALVTAAHSIDPNFDETKWGIRFAQRKNYEAGGKQFQEAQALNTVSGHLVNLMKSADALENTPYPIVNGVMNWLRQNSGDPRVDKLNTDIHAVTSELSKAYKAGHVSDADVRAWNNNINSAKSPEQFKAVIGELNDLLRSKRETLDEGYRSAMGKTPMPEAYSSQSERSKGNFDSVSDWSLGNKKPASSGGWSVKKL